MVNAGGAAVNETTIVTTLGTANASFAGSDPERSFDGTQEICRFTNLVARLIQEALIDAQPHLDGLTQEILGLARIIDALEQEIAHLTTGVEHSSSLATADGDTAKRAIQHLQVSDRLSQRLANTARMLSQLTRLLENAGIRLQAREWQHFLVVSRATCTTAEECQTFECVFPTYSPPPDLGGSL